MGSRLVGPDHQRAGLRVRLYISSAARAGGKYPVPPHGNIAPRRGLFRLCASRLLAWWAVVGAPWLCGGDRLAPFSFAPLVPLSVSRLLSPPPPPTLALLDSPPFFGSGGAVTSRLLCRSTGDGADRLSFRGGSPGICLGFGRSRGVWAALRVDRRRSRAVGLLRWLRRRSSQEAQIAEEAQVSIGLVDKMGCT